MMREAGYMVNYSFCLCHAHGSMGDYVLKKTDIILAQKY